jgi:hypothetical protein
MRPEAAASPLHLLFRTLAWIELTFQRTTTEIRHERPEEPTGKAPPGIEIRYESDAEGRPRRSPSSAERCARRVRIGDG